MNELILAPLDDLFGTPLDPVVRSTLSCTSSYSGSKTHFPAPGTHAARMTHAPANSATLKDTVHMQPSFNPGSHESKPRLAGSRTSPTGSLFKVLEANDPSLELNNQVFHSSTSLSPDVGRTSEASTSPGVPFEAAISIGTGERSSARSNLSGPGEADSSPVTSKRALTVSHSELTPSSLTARSRALALGAEHRKVFPLGGTPQGVFPTGAKASQLAARSWQLSHQWRDFVSGPPRACR